MSNSNFKKEKMSNSFFKKEKMSNVLVAELLFKVISYLSTFFLNNKKRKKSRTKRKKCWTKGQNVDLCKISIQHFFIDSKRVADRKSIFVATYVPYFCFAPGCLLAASRCLLSATFYRLPAVCCLVGIFCSMVGNTNLGMSNANYHPIMCCHLWLISHVRLTAAAGEPGHTSQPGLPARSNTDPPTQQSNVLPFSGYWLCRLLLQPCHWCWSILPYLSLNPAPFRNTEQ